MLAYQGYIPYQVVNAAIARLSDACSQYIYESNAELLVDEWRDWLHAVGFTDVDIRYSGFFNQGDGASFTGRLTWISKFLEFSQNPVQWVENSDTYYPGRKHCLDPLCQHADLLRVRRFEDLCYVAITRVSHHYAHEQTVRVTAELQTTRSIEAISRQFDKLIAAVNQFKYVICHEIYNSLSEAYVYASTEEALANDLEGRADDRLVLSLRPSGEITVGKL